MKRYEIRWTALDPTQGAEMAKTRPAVIVGCPEPTLADRDGVPVDQRIAPHVAVPIAGAL